MPENYTAERIQSSILIYNCSTKPGEPRDEFFGTVVALQVVARIGKPFNQPLLKAMPRPSNPDLGQLSELRGSRTLQESSPSCRMTDELHPHARR
jgi:hypothetical protein